MKVVREILKSQKLPLEVREILYDRREEIMVRNMLRAPGNKVVAIVGMAHLDGIEKTWQNEYFWETLDKFNLEPFVRDSSNRFNAWIDRFQGKKKQ